MWELVSTVLLASLAGSLHCAAMCGGLATFAVASDGQASKRIRLGLHALYHLGRWLAYVTLGGLAGIAGRSLDLALFRTVGVSGTWLAGLLVIAWAVRRLLLERSSRSRPLRASRLVPRPRSLSGVFRLVAGSFERVVRAGYAWAAQRPGLARSLSMGLASGLLPCGWLYAFVALAVATANPLTGVLALTGFWVGTVPGVAATSVISRLALRFAGRFAARLPVLAVLFAAIVTILSREFLMPPSPSNRATESEALLASPAELVTQAKTMTPPCHEARPPTPRSELVTR